MTEGKLVFLPKGYRVVPEELNDSMEDILYYGRDTNIPDQSLYTALIAAAPPIDTPPVLRWEGRRLMAGNKELAFVWNDVGGWGCNLRFSDCYTTEQEARRAAEKALGFPDGLVVEEV